MNRQHDGAAAPRQVAHRLHDQLLVGQVQCRGGFVQQQQRAARIRRIPDLGQHSRQLHALALATRELRIQPRPQGGDIGGRHNLFDDLLVRCPAGGMGHAPEGDDFLHGVGKIEQRQLGQVGQPPRQLQTRPLLPGSLADQQLATGRGDITGDQAQQGGLACAVGSRQSQHLSRLQRQVDFREQRRAPGRGAHRAQLQGRHDCIP